MAIVFNAFHSVIEGSYLDQYKYFEKKLLFQGGALQSNDAEHKF